MGFSWDSTLIYVFAARFFVKKDNMYQMDKENTHVYVYRFLQYIFQEDILKLMICIGQFVHIYIHIVL